MNSFVGRRTVFNPTPEPPWMGPLKRIENDPKIQNGRSMYAALASSVVAATREKEDPTIASVEELFRSIVASRKTPRVLAFTPRTFANPEHRQQMQDVTLCHCTPSRGALIGIFDGHGDYRPWYIENEGGLFAMFAKNFVQDHFFPSLEKVQGDPKATFRRLFQEIDRSPDARKYDYGGSTAVVGFIDPKNILYTATVGDSSAVVYRKLEGRWKAIPVSWIHHWQDPCVKARLEQDKTGNKLKDPNPTSPSLKRFYYTKKIDRTLAMGINMPSSLGDLMFKGDPALGSALIADPEVTVFPLRSGDVVSFQSDGVDDVVQIREIAGIVASICDVPTKEVNEVTARRDKIADAILDLAKRKGSQDNISLVLGIII